MTISKFSNGRRDCGTPHERARHPLQSPAWDAAHLTQLPRRNSDVFAGLKLTKRIMKRKNPWCSTTVLVTSCCVSHVRVNAFVSGAPLTVSRSTVPVDDRSSTSRREKPFSFRTGHDTRRSPSLWMSPWSAEERLELVRDLAEWQERDEAIGASGIKILTDSTPPAVLTRYYESLAARDEKQVVLVAPSCTVEKTYAAVFQRALSGGCASRVYHPEAEESERRAPHLALWHEEAPEDIFSPSTLLSEQTAALSQSAVMEEVFLWLQRTMLAMVDDEEEVFVELGRKLLTVHKYVVANATTEADLSRTFWAEASALTKHSVAAAEKIASEGGTMAIGGGVGGGGDPREASVLLALPGFRFKDRSSFSTFAEQKLVEPLRALSPHGQGAVELFADIYAGEDLKFPVIIMSPFLERFEAPEGGYKFIDVRGEERDADEYIRESEEKLARQAAERLAQHEEQEIFPPHFPPVDEEQ